MYVEQNGIGRMRTLRGFFKETGNAVFPMGAQRGNPGTDDWYHMVFVRLRYPIFDRAVDVGYPRFFLPEGSLAVQQFLTKGSNADLHQILERNPKYLQRVHHRHRCHQPQ
jgi:hypothetical protein